MTPVEKRMKGTGICTWLAENKIKIKKLK